jgi:hypothetical protein
MIRKLAGDVAQEWISISRAGSDGRLLSLVQGRRLSLAATSTPQFQSVPFSFVRFDCSNAPLRALFS